MAEMTADFLTTILPSDREGFLIVAVGFGPHRDANGKHSHSSWQEVAFQWPSQADTAVEQIQLHAAKCDVYVCPYLMKGAKRHKGDAACRQLVHADVDDVVDLDKVREVGGFVVWSGSPGHGHVYVPLKHVVMPNQHEALCRGLSGLLGGDKAKVSENDVLRPPGTFNHKYSPMTFVTMEQP